MRSQKEKNVYLREWKKRNPEKYKASWKRYNEAHKDVINARNRQRAIERKDIYRKWYDEKRAIIKDLKSVPCSDCSRDYPWYVMDFDHVSGKKSGNVSRMLGRPLNVILDEISKCEVVCSNCHRERTFKRGDYGVNNSDDG